ncbi:MAG: hypothetical protein HC841_01830 [Verrucomicrobiae bacterium]|nr:hypothetical protein [Verrucomicrobiae bacterium]
MKKTIQTLSALALGLTAAAFPAAAGTVEVTADITVNTTWSATNTYILRKVVFVQTNAVLTIEPGTVIKGGVSNLISSVPQGIPNLVSALWVTRGARLEACGTPSKPIIFTAETDDVNNPTDLPLYSSGIWGGVVLMGNAVLNSAQLGVGQSNSPIYDIYEGTSILTNNAFTAFGGTNDNDNSGTLKYVSIRYTGNTFATDRELNGLTMGGLGKGTTIEHVEVIGSSDDGFEWWGGCVDSKYLVAAFIEDDCFDTDQGYRGRNQFWFAIQKPVGPTDRLIEADGDLNQLLGNALPTSTWEIHNFTGIGTGPGAGLGLNFRDEAFPRMNNSVMAHLATATTIDSDGLAGHTLIPPTAWISNTVAQATTLHSANAGALAAISAAAG